MIVLTNFREYTPEDPAKEELKKIGALFLKCDEGIDWYDCQKMFDSNTQKIMFDENGLINSITQDVSGFFPENSSVAEVDEVPDDFTINLTHMYDSKTGKIVKREFTSEELEVKASNKISKEIKDALNTIAPLQMAEKYGMATDEEKSSLEAWEKYIVLLNRVSSQKGYPTEIEWPQKPE